jgi:hypothetical protein
VRRRGRSAQRRRIRNRDGKRDDRAARRREHERRNREGSFAPRFSWTYSEGSGPKRSTWIVLTEKEPPVEAWIAAKDREEARRVWCGKEKTPFAAVKLDAERKVDLYFLCPADGGVDTRMVSSWNGLESVVLHFDVHDAKRLKGTLRTGEGSCPAGEHGEADYCTKTGDYAFDAPIAR